MDSKNTSDILQIDLLKGLAIISVVIGHIVAYQVLLTNPQVLTTVSNQILTPEVNQINFNFINSLSIGSLAQVFTHWITYSALLTQQVVPLFIMIMSFNLSLSFSRRKYYKLEQFFSKIQIKNKIRRFFVPFLIVFFISLIIGILIELTTNRQILNLNFRLLMGYLPINGPGAYFIPLIIQMIVLFPLLYLFYRYNRNACILVGFVLAFACEIFNQFGTNGIWYDDSLVRFFPHIILGIWISDLYLESQLKNKFLMLFGVLSGIYLISVSQFESGILWGIHFVPYTADQNLFASGWTAMLLIIGLMYLPKVKNIFTYPLALIGKATYHIYLVQIVYFGVWGGFGLKYHTFIDLFSINNIIMIAIPFSIVVLIGLGFYELDNNNFFCKKSGNG